MYVIRSRKEIKYQIESINDAIDKFETCAMFSYNTKGFLKNSGWYTDGTWYIIDMDTVIDEQHLSKINETKKLIRILNIKNILCT